MNKNPRLDKIVQSIEYQIRRTERGIKVLYAQGGDVELILEYGEKRERLKDELERLTKGRREPEAPEWPL